MLLLVVVIVCAVWRYGVGNPRGVRPAWPGEASVGGRANPARRFRSYPGIRGWPAETDTSGDLCDCMRSRMKIDSKIEIGSDGEDSYSVSLGSLSTVELISSGEMLSWSIRSVLISRAFRMALSGDPPRAYSNIPSTLIFSTYRTE